MKIDVEGMVSALGSMLLEDLDPQHPEHSKAMQVLRPTRPLVPRTC